MKMASKDRIDMQLVCNGKAMNLSDRQIMEVLDSLDLSESENDDFIDELAQSYNSEIRELVALSSNISDQSLKKLSLDLSYKVRWNILNQPENITRMSADELIESADEQPELIKVIFDWIQSVEDHPQANQLIHHYLQHPDLSVRERIFEVLGNDLNASMQ